MRVVWLVLIECMSKQKKDTRRSEWTQQMKSSMRQDNCGHLHDLRRQRWLFLKKWHWHWCMRWKGACQVRKEGWVPGRRAVCKAVHELGGFGHPCIWLNSKASWKKLCSLSIERMVWEVLREIGNMDYAGLWSHVKSCVLFSTQRKPPKDFLLRITELSS